MSNAVERCKSQLSSFAKAAALLATSRSAYRSEFRAGAAKQFMKSDFDLFPSNMFRGAWKEIALQTDYLSMFFRRISDVSRRILKSLFSGENVNSDYEFVMSE